MARRRAILNRIAEACRRSGRNPDEVTLLGVTKTQPLETVRNGIAAGIEDIGENYVQEMVEKHKHLGDSARWHSIGHLQRNKVEAIAPFVHLIHGLDSERLAVEIDRQGRRAGRRIGVLIQVNTSGEASKSGIPPREAVALARSIARLPSIELQGLMTIPAPVDNPEESRSSFRLLRALCEEARQSGPLPHLSMGMTDDFEVAVEEGATIVRIGTALFGPRNRVE